MDTSAQTPQARPPAAAGSLLRQDALAAIIDSALDAIITIDAQQRIRQFNRAACDMFGHTECKVLAQALDLVIPLDSRNAHRRLVDGYLCSGITARPMGEPRGLTGLRSDGSAFPIQASISRSGHGEATLMTVVVRDAGRLREAEAARRAYAAAAAAHHARSEFLSRMSHELRTPLNAILGLTELLQIRAHERLTEAAHVQLILVRAAGARLRALIDGILQFVPPAPAARGAPPPPDEGAPVGMVLYVEDDEINVLLVQEMLKLWPRLQLLVAQDGKTGLDLARRLQPDLILLDMHLPDMTGLQVIRALRSDEATRHLKIAVLSASALQADVADAAQAGAMRYWTKPISYAEFLSGIRELLSSPGVPGL